MYFCSPHTYAFGVALLTENVASLSVPELLVLRDLLSTMGGIKYDVSTVSQDEIDSRAGGERLRLAVQACVNARASERMPARAGEDGCVCLQ